MLRRLSDFMLYMARICDDPEYPPLARFFDTLAGHLVRLDRRLR